MNEIELARQQLLEHRVDQLTVFIPSALGVLASIVVAMSAVVMGLRDKGKDRFDKFGSVVLCALIVAVFSLMFAIPSMNQFIDTYIAPNTIVPGYVPEK